MDTLEQINQLTTQFGLFQTTIILIILAVVAYIVFSVRSMYVLSRGTSKQGETVALLAKLLETNSEKSEGRWHKRMETYEVERVTARQEINEMRTQMTSLVETNSYGKGVIATLTAAYKEHREKAEANAIDMRGEIDSLKRQVEANKRTIEGLTKSIADKNEHISDLGQKVSALEKENNDLKLQLGKRDKQLAKLKEENNKPQLPNEPSSK